MFLPGREPRLQSWGQDTVGEEGPLGEVGPNLRECMSGRRSKCIFVGGAILGHRFLQVCLPFTEAAPLQLGRYKPYNNLCGHQLLLGWKARFYLWPFQLVGPEKSPASSPRHGVVSPPVFTYKGCTRTFLRIIL